MVDLILAGSSSIMLAVDVARRMGLDAIVPVVRKFPDGEIYVRITKAVEDKSVAVIHTLGGNPNDLLIEYLLVVKTLKDLGAKEVIAVIPYLAYARQDARFKEGEAVSARIIAELIESAGTSKVLTIDAHLHRIESIDKLFNIKALNVSAVPELAKYIAKNYSLRNPIVVGPDEESEQWAKVAAKVLNTDYIVLEKKRLGDEEVIIESSVDIVKNRDVVIVDDIISTGGTMVETIHKLKEANAGKILVSCIHPVLSANALNKILLAGAYDIVATDTIQSPVSKVTVSPVIAENLPKL